MDEEVVRGGCGCFGVQVVLLCCEDEQLVLLCSYISSTSAAVKTVLVCAASSHIDQVVHGRLHDRCRAQQSERHRLNTHVTQLFTAPRQGDVVAD